MKYKVLLLLVALVLLAVLLIRVANQDGEASRRFAVTQRCHEQALELATTDTFETFMTQCRAEAGY